MPISPSLYPSQYETQLILAILCNDDWHFALFYVTKHRVFQLPDAQLFYYGDFQKMLISPAFAQSAGGGGDFTSLLPFVLIFVVFYFFLIRPQQKRAKEHREMVSQLRRGDKVITSGGLVGTVTKSVDDQETVEVEIAKDVKVNIMRTMIADKRSKDDKAKKANTAEAPKKSGLAGLFGGGKK